MIGVTGELELADIERIFDEGDWEGSAGEGVQYCSIQQMDTSRKKVNLRKNKKNQKLHEL